MKAIIYCFSGTGNTKRICMLYKETFEKRGVETTLYSVCADMAGIPNAAEYDLVGFAYPIHAFNAPKIMLALAKAMPPVNEKEYFILKSSGEPLKINNASSLRLIGLLRKKGFVFKSEYHYIMPYNMIFRHTDQEALRMWQTAQALCPIEAEEVLTGKEHKLPRLFGGGLFAWIMRIEQPAMQVNGKLFKVKRGNCIMCRKCETNCPVANIRIDGGGRFHFGGHCLMCTRCSFACPTDAIGIGILNGWRVNGAYPLDKPIDKTAPEPQHKHKWYCRKAYDRYFASATEKIESSLSEK